MSDDRDYVKLAWPKLNILYFETTGNYQGTNYVIGYADGKVLASGYGYGSCSGCGAWGEGGEPTKPEDLIDSGVFGKSLEETLGWADNVEIDSVAMKAEIKRAFNLIEEHK